MNVLGNFLFGKFFSGTYQSFTAKIRNPRQSSYLNFRKILASELQLAPKRGLSVLRKIVETSELKKINVLSIFQLDLRRSARQIALKLITTCSCKRKKKNLERKCSKKRFTPSDGKTVADFPANKLLLHLFRDHGDEIIFRI